MVVKNSRVHLDHTNNQTHPNTGTFQGFHARRVETV
jgi:hypothetical protein